LPQDITLYNYRAKLEKVCRHRHPRNMPNTLTMLAETLVQPYTPLSQLNSFDTTSPTIPVARAFYRDYPFYCSWSMSSLWKTTERGSAPNG
jgi:hypothetical protein